MCKNDSTHLSENDKLNLQLIQKQVLGSFLVIVAYIIFIQALEISQKSILEEDNNIKSTYTSQSVELIALSSELALLGNVILGDVALIRLERIKNSSQSSANSSEINAALNIYNGFSFSFIGNLLKMMGALEILNKNS